MDAWTLFVGAACALGVVATLSAYRLGARRLEVASKCFASACFVAVWFLRADAPSPWLLLGLLGCFAGDVLLLGRGSRMFAAGLAAFLLAHVFYGVVLLAHGRIDWAVFGISSIGLGMLGVLTYRWLYPRLPARLRGAVAVYFVVLLAMCALAAGATATSHQWLWLLGALAFAASDLAVALHRFVDGSGVHRLWGLPLYYAAQLILALSLP